MGMDLELYRFRAIIGHQGPLLASDPHMKGSKYNVQVEWETGEITFEPLSIIAADDPVTCAAYKKENEQHMPKRITYLLWRDGIDSEVLPRRIRSLQEQLSKVRSGKSGDLKLICLGISSPETTWRPCNLTLRTRIANGMMPSSFRWNPCKNTKYSKSGIKQSLINIRKSKTLLKVITEFKFI